MRQRYASRTPKSAQRVLEAARPVRVDYVEAADLSRWLATSADHPLAIISFGPALHQSLPCPVITLNLPELDGRTVFEVWSCDQPVTVHREKDLFAAMSPEVLALSIQVEEEPGGGLQRTTEQAYRHLLDRVRMFGYPYLWRVWNFFPAINEPEQGLERYRQFCMGRHAVLEKGLPGFPGTVPAGTAVGTRSGPLQIHALAGAHPAVHLGNPRQVHAYDYPRQYGPCSPSFARATLCRFEEGFQLFLSGTASVVGHESQHPGAPQAQVEETVENIRSLLAHAERTARSIDRVPSWHGSYKVYVRHPEHLPAVRQALRHPLFASSQVVFLQGDLCRQELLVEVEGFVTTD